MLEMTRDNTIQLTKINFVVQLNYVQARVLTLAGIALYSAI